MKITIDTKEDSKDEIKKVISLLKNMLDEPVSNVNIFEDKSQQGGLLNIFGSDDKSESSEVTTNTDNLLKETNTIEKTKNADDLLKETNVIEEKDISNEKSKVETY